MSWHPVNDNIKWRRGLANLYIFINLVIMKFSDPDCPKLLSLSLGDWVYVDQSCKGLLLCSYILSVDWFYGWKCDAFEKRGIFPICCTDIPSDNDVAEIYAEIMSFFPVAEQFFIVVYYS